ncbi:lipase family protein [Paenibacillus glycanilyticus]|uniref:lipase family protein n=1 Tax=Paenibacillus glycanilyticus TaxID=126569 RepID=UPI000FD82FEA|nr:lipase family protein [Paenibacillus glycanilyticus]
MSNTISMEKLIDWGHFVKVAYEMYAQNHLSPVKPADFPAGWELVANLTMTPHLEKMQEREFGGFIARSADNPLQQAVVIRGTESPLDWLSDFEFILETFHEVPDGGKTEQGFTNLYRSMMVEYADASIPSETLMASIDALPQGTRLLVTGHSLGSSLATLHAFLAGSKNVDVELITFASPRVGDKSFVEAFQRMNIPNTRIFNTPDIVPQVPVEIAGYRHLEPGLEINSALYPIKHSIPCYHALSTYLYVMGDTEANISKCKTTP